MGLKVFIVPSKGNTWTGARTLRHKLLYVPRQLGRLVVNYFAHRKMKEIFTKKSYNLLEKCAEVLCDSLLNEYKEIEKIKLTLKKPEAPIKEDFEYVGIEITRNRKEKR